MLTPAQRAALLAVARQAAARAASGETRDPRFPPLGARHLPALGVDVSVLAPARRVSDPAEIELGRHGLEIRRGRKRGLLLPQVAADHGMDRETFLAETCRKAGLPARAWREADTEIWCFEAEVFGG